MIANRGVPNYLMRRTCAASRRKERGKRGERNRAPQRQAGGLRREVRRRSLRGTSGVAQAGRKQVMGAQVEEGMGEGGVERPPKLKGGRIVNEAQCDPQAPLWSRSVLHRWRRRVLPWLIVNLDFD